MRLIRSLFFFVIALAPLSGRADDASSKVRSYVYAADESWTITIISGTAAKDNWERLSPGFMHVMRRRETGEVLYRLKTASTMYCTQSVTRTPTDPYAYYCAWALNERGEVAGVTVDPDMRTTPRIGVGN